VCGRGVQGVLDVCDIPLVSIDFRCSDVSSTIDSSLTMVMGDDMVKVVAWYDNEWGYRSVSNLLFPSWIPHHPLLYLVTNNPTSPPSPLHPVPPLAIPGY